MTNPTTSSLRHAGEKINHPLSHGNGNGTSVVHVASSEMLEKVADELEQQIPKSLAILTAVKSRQLGEILQDFYVDQWPSANVYIGIIKPEYFYKFKTPPYQILNFYARTDDSNIIQQTFNSLQLDWNLPIFVSAGPNKQQLDIISDLFKQHNGIPIVKSDEPRRFYYMTKATVRPPVPVPDGYEYVRLTKDDLPEILKNWGYVNKPFLPDDIETLMERFPFAGVRDKSAGKLVAFGGQLHNGTAGGNRVDPEHRGKKLFQVVLSRIMPNVVERYGYATAAILETNIPSISAFTKVGFQYQEGHLVYWIYMHPAASGPCSWSW